MPIEKNNIYRVVLYSFNGIEIKEFINLGDEGDRLYIGTCEENLMEFSKNIRMNFEIGKFVNIHEACKEADNARTIAFKNVKEELLKQRLALPRNMGPVKKIINPGG